jgi:hypothetical protein
MPRFAGDVERLRAVLVEAAVLDLQRDEEALTQKATGGREHELTIGALAPAQMAV